MIRRMKKMTLWVAIGVSSMALPAADREGAFDSYRFTFEQRQQKKKAAAARKQKRDKPEAADEAAAPQPVHEKAAASARKQERDKPEAAGEAAAPEPVHEKAAASARKQERDKPEAADEASAPDPVYYDEAVPPPGVMEGGAEAERAVVLPASLGRERGVNLGGHDIARATFQGSPVQVGPGHVGDGLAGVEGRFTYSVAGERRPIPIYVQYGFVTVIEFRNGEHPTGGAFCGLCGESGAFDVQALSSRVGIKPREMSSRGSGTLATNLTIITDQDRTYTFNVVEISGLGLVRTDRHEVRVARTAESPILGFSFQNRVDAARAELEEEAQAEIQEARESVVTEKATQRMETRYKFRGYRGEIEIESVVTIGDETVVKLLVPKGRYGDPVAVIERGRRKHRRVSLVPRRSTQAQPNGDAIEVTLTLDAVDLDHNERLRITLADKTSGEELRAIIEAA